MKNYKKCHSGHSDLVHKCLLINKLSCKVHLNIKLVLA